MKKNCLWQFFYVAANSNLSRLKDTFFKWEWFHTVIFVSKTSIFISLVCTFLHFATTRLEKSIVQINDILFFFSRIEPQISGLVLMHKIACLDISVCYIQTTYTTANTTYNFFFMSFAGWLIKTADHHP